MSHPLPVFFPSFSILAETPLPLFNCDSALFAPLAKGRRGERQSLFGMLKVGKKNCSGKLCQKGERGKRKDGPFKIGRGKARRYRFVAFFTDLFLDENTVYRGHFRPLLFFAGIPISLDPMGDRRRKGFLSPVVVEEKMEAGLPQCQLFRKIFFQMLFWSTYVFL